jgi:nucleoside-diphosphate-sugar epimerase
MENKTILVTGGTGYIGSWVVKYLLARGYTVRLAVRDRTNTEKLRHLEAIQRKKPGKMEVWEADLMKEGSFDEAAKGADAIIHVASPFTLRIKDARRELIDPALNGTQNVLGAANRSGSVKKVVLTSSVAAIYGDNVDMLNKGLSEFTEDHYNTSSTEKHQPYSFSKVSAENEAWKMAKAQHKWKLVVINPSFVLGPSLTGNSDSESLHLMNRILGGELFFGAPDISFGFVDVRDTAYAHILALENEHASGRYIISERTMSMIEMTRIIKKLYPGKYRLPFMKAPKIILMMVGRFFGVTADYVKRNVGYPIRFNNSRSRKNLGLKYRPIEETLKDMIVQMEKSKESNNNIARKKESEAAA